MKYLKQFKQTSEYEVFKESEDYVLPNVSYIEEGNKVEYNPFVESVEPLLLKLNNNYPEINSLIDELYHTYFEYEPTEDLINLINSHYNGYDDWQSTWNNRKVSIALTDDCAIEFTNSIPQKMYKSGDVLLHLTQFVDESIYVVIGNIKTNNKFKQLFELYVDQTYNSPLPSPIVKLDSIVFQWNRVRLYYKDQAYNYTENVYYQSGGGDYAFDIDNANGDFWQETFD